VAELLLAAILAGAGNFVKTAIAFIACLWWLTSASAADINAGAPTITVPVDLELVLAVDVSRSMDPEEAALQRAGYVDAISHPDFIRAIKSGANGRIALTYFEWAGDVREESVVPWQIIDSPESAIAFADRIVKRSYGGFRGTSISSALTFGTAIIEGAEYQEARRVIDVSGDGPNNIGAPVEAARDIAVSAGITINGLPILIRPSPTFTHLDDYYADCVTGGPGSFVLPIYAASEFATAIRRKLILEVSSDMPPPGVILAAAAGQIDCLKGERDRRFYTDPYFPELDK
jgi:hypothetical protein